MTVRGDETRRPVPAAELAQSLLDDYVNSSNLDRVANFSFDQAASERYAAKMRFYRLALALLVLKSEEEKASGFGRVRECLENLVIPGSQAESVPAVIALRSAMKDLGDLITPHRSRQEFSWARNWLGEIAVDEFNPARLALLASYWMDALVEVTKMMRQFQPS